jgi:hypothetical protein
VKKRQRTSNLQKNNESHIFLVSTTNTDDHEDVRSPNFQQNTEIGTLTTLSIVYMMLQNIDNVAYQFWSIHTLLRCHIGEKVMPAIADSIVSIMKWHPHNIHLQLICLDLLYLLTACSRDLRVLIASNEHRDLTYILDLMENESSNRYLQQIGLGFLSLIAEDEHGRKAIFEEGGMARIVSSLQLHKDDPFVQCNGSAVLCWLVHSNEYQQLEVQPTRLTVELTSILLEQLSKHMNDPCIFGKLDTL